jgi:ribonuclease-3
MGLKKITLFNKMDGSLKVSQIFGNTLEALVGAFYLDLGYKKTAKWVLDYIILPHMFMDDLEIWRSTIKTNFMAGPIKMA